MRLALITAAAAAALTYSTFAAAQPAAGGTPPAKVQTGERVYSSDGAVIGRIEYLDRAKDGALKDVGVIQNMRMVHIPAETLSTGPNGLVTTLKRSDVSKLD
jgi:hypothetical protein